MTDDEFEAEFRRQTECDVRSFFVGYLFSQIVGDAMGAKLKHPETAAFLKEIATGKTTLVDSPPDIVGDVERNTGRPVSEAQRAFIFRNASGEMRQHSDTWHKLGAIAILRMMGEKLET